MNQLWTLTFDGNVSVIWTPGIGTWTMALGSNQPYLAGIHAAGFSEII